MDIASLAKAFDTWLRMDTWHTGHPKDDERFHRSLKSAFDDVGIHISSDDFRKAIIAGLKMHRPGDVNAFENDIEEFAQRAEDIASYLIDQKR